MSNTTKDPLDLARAALKVGEAALAPYSHPKSPRKFTQPQLFAMLALKEFFRRDYRSVVTWLEQWSELRDVLGLKRVPHYSTLAYAEKRLLKKGALPGSLMSAFATPSAAA
jgi:hypothetical protein